MSKSNTCEKCGAQHCECDYCGTEYIYEKALEPAIEKLRLAQLQIQCIIDTQRRTIELERKIGNNQTGGSFL